MTRATLGKRMELIERAVGIVGSEAAKFTPAIVVTMIRKL